MQFDLGLQGLGLLIVLALGVGLVAQVVAARVTTRWLWLAGAAGAFIGGLLASEVVWGTLTEEEIQPIIDGLAFDEVLLFSFLGGVVAVLATRLVTRRGGMGLRAGH